MEPEILFRGKRLDNGEWMYGIPAIFINVSGAPYTAIIPIYSFANDLAGLKAVDPATVGQYTGLSDKNGVKIFKDDILHVVTPNTRGNFQVKFGYGQFYIGINMPIAYVRHSCEVRGNIHDNPELLGGAE